MQQIPVIIGLYFDLSIQQKSMRHLIYIPYILDFFKYDNSHLLIVPAGVTPANALVSSSILHSGGSLQSSGGVAGGMGGGGDGDFSMYGGVDPNLDPEMAMILRMSAEEARAEEEARMRAMQQVSEMKISLSFLTEQSYSMYLLGIC